MKYPEIYKAIDARRNVCGTGDNGIITNDHSGWLEREPNIVHKWRPLWIIVTDKPLNKIIWITENMGDKRIDIAPLDEHPDTRESRRWAFESQEEMADFLRRLFLGEEPEGGYTT